MHAAAFGRERVGDPRGLCIRFGGQGEVGLPPVLALQKRQELQPQQAAFCQHAAVLLERIAEILVQRRAVSTSASPNSAPHLVPPR